MVGEDDIPFFKKRKKEKKNKEYRKKKKKIKKKSVSDFSYHSETEESAQLGNKYDPQ